MAAVILTGHDLSLEEVVRVARDGAIVALAPEALARMRDTRNVLETAVARGDTIYGVTTGVGMRKRTRVPVSELHDFNQMLILNHRVGQGDAASAEAARAMMVVLANSLATGAPGARPEVAERVVAALNDSIAPAVRSLGSVGQADLAATADLAHELAADVEAGDGLALLNNNSFATGLAALAVADGARFLDAADIAGALDLEAFAANVTMLHPEIGEVRPYAGLRESLTRMRQALEGSYLWNPGAARNLQDPLTFRCLPQVHGAARDALAFAKRQLDVELNSAQGNPLVIQGEGRVVSVANFDVLPLAAALDFLRIALAPVLASAAERAIKLLQAPLSGLPEGLAVQPGLAEDSLSEFGVPAQALAAEARLLAQPVSFELVSTSHAEGIEDRMTMAPLAARRLSEMVELGERLIAIELVIAAQAIDLRDRPRLGARTRPAYEAVREVVPFCGLGDPIPQDLEPIRQLVRSGTL